MNQQELKEWDMAQRRYRAKNTKSKAAARRIFKKLGILHLLVPIGTNKTAGN
jgi:hypothetical protein